jgi:hypothetical protein
VRASSPPLDVIVRQRPAGTAVIRLWFWRFVGVDKQLSEAEKCVRGWCNELRTELQRMKRLSTQPMSCVVLGDTVLPDLWPTRQQ